MRPPSTQTRRPNSAQSAVDPNLAVDEPNLAADASDRVGIIAAAAAGERSAETAHDAEPSGEPGSPEDPPPSQTAA